MQENDKNDNTVLGVSQLSYGNVLDLAVAWYMHLFIKKTKRTQIF